MWAGRSYGLAQRKPTSKCRPVGVCERRDEVRLKRASATKAKLPPQMIRRLGLACVEPVHGLECGASKSRFRSNTCIRSSKRVPAFREVWLLESSVNGSTGRGNSSPSLCAGAPTLHCQGARQYGEASIASESVRHARHSRRKRADGPCIRRRRAWTGAGRGSLTLNSRTSFVSTAFGARTP
jgi:hypothetical protein